MLSPLQAERQLLAIEAATLAHMKPEDAKRVRDRHIRQMQPRDERKPRGMAAQLHEAFGDAGFAVVEEPTTK